MRQSSSLVLLTASLILGLLWSPTAQAQQSSAPQGGEGFEQLNEDLQRARALSDEGRFADALPLFEKTLDALAGQPPSTTLASLTNETAVIHYHLGQLDEAEKLYREAILIHQTAEPLDEASLATSLNNLAALHHRQRDFESAEPLYQRALELRRKAQGPDHPDVAFSLNELAMLYHSQRRLEEATQLYVESLAIEEKTLGLEHPNLAPRLSNLAVLYRLQGLFNRAEPLFQRALEIQRQTLGPDHPEVALAINNLGVLYSVMGRHGEAEDLYHQALAIQQRFFGERHISIAVGLRNLAILYDRQGDAVKAWETARNIRSILDENCRPSAASPLSADDRAVCQNALAMQEQLVEKLGIDLDAEPSSAPSAPQAAEPTRPTTVDSSPTVASAPPATGEPTTVFRAQVRSSQQQHEAEAELARMSRQFATPLAGTVGHIQRVDLGAKGIWFRVQFGAFDTSARAQELCRKLQSAGLESCWVAKTSP